MNTHDAPAEFTVKLDVKPLKKLHRQVKARRFRKYLQAYTAIPSRHYRHSGNRYAVQMLCDDFERISEKLKVATLPFSHENQTLHNVEAKLDSNIRGDKRIILICAHLDSTAEGDPGYQPLLDEAPGADDDASGITAVLLAAHAVEKLRQMNDGPMLHREIRFVLFNAEEARQCGSRNYVESLGDGQVIAVYNMDMIGYKSSQNILEVHAGYTNSSMESEVQGHSLVLASVIKDLQPALAPGLKVQVYPGEDDKRDVAQGFGDHTSFHEAGIPACLVTENFFTGPGTIGLAEPNPNHHLPEDRPEHLDLEYAAGIARVVAGAAWYTATAPIWPPNKGGNHSAA
ncbi:MAG TPA: M28 family peptidase [Longimicrobium sp.]|jgi:hypothetical protein|uniref:M28 family metallopeptidase n=1 Tax=Longimicrobium sp. TaxID=2029185 RepID=UPI002EDAA09E